ncbi:MAG: OsmC family protein [bacterium]
MSDSSSSSRRESLAWKARVTPIVRHRATVHVRRHSFVVGKPVEFDIDADAISAVEYLLGALGADLVNGLLAVARRRRVDIDHAEAAVEGQLDNPLTHLAVVGETGHPGLARATVKVYVSSPAPEDHVRGAWEEAIDRSPLTRTLRGSVDLDLTLQVVP